MSYKLHPPSREISADDGMPELYKVFPEQEANENSQVIFSTREIQGYYISIEDSEKIPEFDTVSFVIIQPREILTSQPHLYPTHQRGITLHGQCRPETPEDFAFLKRLRKTSRVEILKIERATKTKSEPPKKSSYIKLTKAP